VKKQDKPGQRDVAAAVANAIIELTNNRESEVDDLMSNRTKQHALSVMTGHATPDVDDQGRPVPRAEMDQREKLEAVARMLIERGELKPEEFDPEMSAFAADVNRAQSYDRDVKDTGFPNAMSKDAIIDVLAEAVLRRRSEGM
jgi:hypothetical protein